jgi:BioD-like phosphotransacetylase family protein
VWLKLLPAAFVFYGSTVAKFALRLILAAAAERVRFVASAKVQCRVVKLATALGIQIIAAANQKQRVKNLATAKGNGAAALRYFRR